MADTSIPLLYGIVAILTIFLLHQIMLLIDLKLKPLKTVIGGKPAVVINKNGIDISQMKKNNLDLSDLIESMRGAGCFSLDDAEYALYEANGNFSVLPKEKEKSDEAPSVPLLIIDEGKYNKQNLEKIRLDEKFFDGILREQNVAKPEKVFVLTLDGNGKIYMQLQKEKFRTFQIQLPEGCKW